ncbi:MAG: hypothetical protein KA793_05375, partial [Bacteroidales bacterium]|nr:hypothetical protein [Bacteroidales bacterium]
MKKLFIILALLLVSGIVPIVAQQNSNLDFAYEKLAIDKGFFFSFDLPEHEIMLNLFNQISIDGFENGRVLAYANEMEFNKFLTYGIDFLPNYDYYNSPKISSANMATTVAQMANWDKYPTHSVYVQMLQNFKTNYPALCKIDTIGYSINGWPILCLIISDNVGTDEDEPEFWWSGTMHGDEITGYVLLLRFADYLLSNYSSNPTVANMVNNMEIYINPLANPDGTFFGSTGGTLIHDSHRYNANEADLNRSFPMPNGSTPEYSIQPETQCMMDYAADHDFVMAVNTHGGTECVNYPWDTWLSADRPHADNNWWYFVSYVYANEVEIDAPSTYFEGPGTMYNIGGTNTTGVTHGADWYYAYGSRQDYMNYFRNIREMTLELSDTKQISGSSLPTYWNYN